MEVEVIGINDDIFIEVLIPNIGDIAYVLNIGVGNLSVQYVLTEEEFKKLTSISSKK